MMSLASLHELTRQLRHAMDGWVRGDEEDEEQAYLLWEVGCVLEGVLTLLVHEVETLEQHWRTSDVAGGEDGEESLEVSKTGGCGHGGSPPERTLDRDAGATLWAGREASHACRGRFFQGTEGGGQNP